MSQDETGKGVYYTATVSRQYLSKLSVSVITVYIASKEDNSNKNNRFYGLASGKNDPD